MISRIFAVALFCLVGGASSLADDGPGDDSALSLYYPFDEGAPTNLSGNGHDGVLHGDLVVIDLP